MKLRFPVLCAFVGCFILSAAAAPTTNNGALWRPRFATPAIVALDAAKNRAFVAEVRAPASAKAWSASISNDLKTWPCEIASAKRGQINRGTEPGWLVKVRVPADASPELFSLTISNSVSVSIQNQAVSVIPAFATDFYILHVSDEQIVNQMHTDPSGQYHKTVGTWEEIKWMQEPINLIHPRFAIVTGDQIDFNGALDGWNNWANWGYAPNGKRLFSESETSDIENRLSELYFDCHKGYCVPYVETPGNHDVAPPEKRLAGTAIDWHPISAHAYEQWFGQRTWSFRMGDFYVLMHDWSDAGLRSWAEKDFDAASRDPSIHFRLIGQHFHTTWDGAPTGNAAFRPATCDLMLIGHGHTVANIQTSPYCIYEDGPAFSLRQHRVFQFSTKPNGLELRSGCLASEHDE
jgi:hypothetical protein